MSTSVDARSDDPLYRQVRKALEQGIAAGRYDPGKPLPSSRALASELGVSRNTVNLAYQELMAEGFVVSRPRSGLYLNEELHHAAARDRLAGFGQAAGHNPPHARRVAWSKLLAPARDAILPSIEKIPDWQLYPHVFIAGQVDSAAFPTLAWSRALREALYQPHAHFSLRDGVSSDDPMLVELLCRKILPARGIDAEPHEVLVTMGSQEGLSLIARALAGEGSTVAVEDPGYLDARHIFVRAGASLMPLPVDASGVVPPSSLEGISLLHLTPSHHHPTNVTLSIGRRHQLLAKAEASGTVVVEDDYDSELRYQGSPSPALKALDETGHVVYLGTFSKFLAPGLRLGYVVGDPELVDALREARRYEIRHPPGHLQRAMALFIESGQYQRAVRQHRIALRRKWEAICDAIDRHFDWPVTLPPGGVSIWVEGPAELDAVELAASLMRQGVIIERGDICYLDPSEHRNCFRLGFAATKLRSIDRGIELIADAARSQLGRTTRR
jgi:GntR family transcriptional regulator/MocR family aminotransferase